MSVQTTYIPCAGGEDLVSPALNMKPGRLLFGVNYETSVNGGYKRGGAYERFDGRPRPSDASYWLLRFDAGTAAVSAGDTLTGGSSGATGKALLGGVVVSGSYGAADAAGYLILTGVTGSFQDGEDLQVAAATRCVADKTANERGASTKADDDTWWQAAIEDARALIGAVPGSGAILGVWVYDGVVYAFRNNTGSTAAVMHKASASGWQVVNLGVTLDFANGVSEFLEGETVTGSTSGATGIVTDVCLVSGSWGSTAAGLMHLHTVSGTFQNETITSASGQANADGPQVPNALLPNGRFEFVTYNFGGHEFTARMYGCDGVNPPFMFTGVGFAPIDTGMTVNTPAHIAAHKKHLFLAFPGGSVQHSSIGEPLVWSAVTGASEIALGKEITGFRTLQGEALAIATRHQMHVLYGSSAADWNLVLHAENAGAIAHTLQRVGDVVYLDDRGLTSLTAVQAYGDFQSAVFSEDIRPFLDDKKALTVASTVIRSKGQYRLFFADGWGLIATFKGGKLVGFTRTVYEHPAACVANAEIGGEERTFFGASNGFVYEMDAGTSQDGAALESFLRLPYHHYGSPRRVKRFRKIALELEADREASIRFQPEFDYGSNARAVPQIEDFTLVGGGGYWDVDNWDEFYWSEQAVAQAEASIAGGGANMGLLIYSKATYEPPHTIQGVVTHYSMRRLKR